jgi:L-aminopeptidase/D-esterase-like protein
MNATGASITDVTGLRVGHAQDASALTGCSVILPPSGTVGGIDQRGGGVGSRQTDPLRLLHVVNEVHAVVLAGGSAFGLEAATGVARYLEEQGIGFDVGVTRVPIVPTAILFDLAIGHSDVRPDAAMGYAACLDASEGPVREGNVGAGTGATLGKLVGPEGAMKSGLGSAAHKLGSELVVGALVALNPLGEVIDPENGSIIAGARDGAGGFLDSRDVMRKRAEQPGMRFGPGENTVLAVVATNASFNKEQCTKVAQMAQDGISRAVRPAHTMFDGDTVFSLATGQVESDANLVGTFAAEVVTEAILRAVKAAEGAGGLPAWRDLQSPGSSKSEKRELRS